MYEPVLDFSRRTVSTILHGGHLGVATFYLHGKNEISAEDNIWSITGCDFPTECPPEDAVYFRVKPSLIHMLWSLSIKQVPFIADDIAGIVPNVPSECSVKFYGSRWRIMRWLQAYPVALDVKCRALKDD